MAVNATAQQLITSANAYQYDAIQAEQVIVFLLASYSLGSLTIVAMPGKIVRNTVWPSSVAQYDGWESTNNGVSWYQQAMGIGVGAGVEADNAGDLYAIVPTGQSGPPNQNQSNTVKVLT